MSDAFKERMVQDLMRKILGVETNASPISPAYCALRDIRNGHIGKTAFRKRYESMAFTGDTDELAAMLWMKDYKAGLAANGYELKLLPDGDGGGVLALVKV